MHFAHKFINKFRVRGAKTRSPNRFCVKSGEVEGGADFFPWKEVEYGGLQFFLVIYLLN